MKPGLSAPKSDCALHVEHAGEGPAMVLVHGWGLHGEVWQELVDILRARWQVSVVDLPGHGFSEDCGSYDLRLLVHRLAEALPGPRTWVGWSLGALACLQLTLERPQQVSGLGLLAATPRFTAAPDGFCGMAPAVLQSFADELERDAGATLTRFLSLQVQGAAQPQSTLKALRRQWGARPAARPGALHSGLEILRSTDLRSRLGEIQCPAVVIAGSRDRVVAPQASAYLASRLGDARLYTIDGAGHAPFIAHAEPVASYLDTLRMTHTLGDGATP